ncbi:interferon lambda-2-like [Rhineura floridana]|uniref:interferon lambda-2-like n=1 Tax=Rhineura floridana TaxID=261503 RepID=UPI002AC858EA|nr:interferon lambda-2-like [Rhineura floridana]
MCGRELPISVCDKPLAKVTLSDEPPASFAVLGRQPPPLSHYSSCCRRCRVKTIPLLVKQILLAAVTMMVLLNIHHASRAAAKRCHLTHYKPTKALMDTFRDLRNRYEDLRKEAQPWKNCSGEHLRRPQGKLSNLTKWEKLEAVAMELSMAISVLQNQSQPTFSKNVSQVLRFLMPLRDNLLACINHKPSNHKESIYLQEFKEQLQKFNTNNAEQSPKCLEAAVGLNIVRLLTEDISQISHHNHHHHWKSSN